MSFMSINRYLNMHLPFRLLARQLSTSVFEARRAIFGLAEREPKGTKPFKTLHKLKRRGFWGPKLMKWKFPPKHPLEKNPIVRMIQNDQRIAELDENRKLGKNPPKKGAGKKSEK